MKLSEIIKAWEEGKTIQFFDRNSWVDKPPLGEDGTFFATNVKYRIKPTLEYRVGLFNNVTTGRFYAQTVHSHQAAQCWETTTTFKRWLTDWVEVDINE